ncbi:MAG: dihydroorotate dehydrogenase [Proteobacteria bacterium]|nr:dihydroorotate dehydrogenase [Pseudomonadota bacterium]
MEDIDLTVDLGRGLRLANPVMSASGTFGYGEEASRYFDISRLGAVVVKGISAEPRAGNPPPRLVETPSGMLNSIGLQNVGLERFISEKMPFLRSVGARVIVNVLGGSVEEYALVCERLSCVEGIAALEINISCPNVREGGEAFGMKPGPAAELVRVLRTTTDMHMMVKLSPNCGDIAGVARAVEEAGADSLSLINAITGMEINLKTRKPVLGNTVGGLSGPAIRPVALRMVHQVRQAVRIPLVGIGGISEGRHALQFMMAGACAVQVGTAFFSDPLVHIRIIDQIRQFLVQSGESARDVVGSLDAGYG